MTNANASVKTEVINNIMLQMSMYLEKSMLDILQRVIEEQFVFLNMDRITTLPATVDRSTEEQNKYFLGLYKIKKRNLSPKTLEQYIRAMEAFVAVIDKPLTEVDTIDVDYYLRQYETRNVASGGKRNQASTMNNERRYLSAFFTWMRKEKFVSHNPVEAIEPFKEIRKPIDYFRPVQMEELREGCISVRDRAIYRAIYLDEVARYHMQKYISQREDDDPALFVASRKPYVRLHTCGVRNILKQIAKRMGMECRVYPHKMRSTLGMNLRNSGVDIGDVSEVLGHANTTVTKRHYAQATPETLRGIRRRAVA